MADDYYDNPSETTAKPAAEPKGETPGEEKSSGKTYLINKEVCPGMKPGEEMVVKIERVLDNEYEVSYAPEPEKEEAAEEPGSEGPPIQPPPGAGPAGGGGGGGEMASMMY